MIARGFFFPAVGLLALAVGTGCGTKYAREESLPSTGARVTGVVKYGNEQIHYGLIRIKVGNQEAAGKIREDGTYLVENCPLGSATIAVNSAAGRGDYQAALMAGGAYTGPDGKGRKRVSLTFTDVPNKFFEPDTSGLTLTVVEGENKHDIAIKK